MRKPILSFGLLVVLAVASSADRQSETNPVDSAGARNQSLSGTFRIQSFPGFVNTDGFKLPPKGDPVDMAYAFFELNQETYHISNPRQELVKRWVRGGQISTTVSFKQVYDGVDLMHSDIRVHFNNRGELERVVGAYIYDINLPTTPQIDSTAAVKVALEDLGRPAHPKVKVPSSPTIVSAKSFAPVKEDKFYMIWIVEIFPDTTARSDLFQRYYIDALNGNILYKQRASTLRD